MTAAVADLSELSASELLDEVDALRRTQFETGVRLLRLVAEFAPRSW